MAREYGVPSLPIPALYVRAALDLLAQAGLCLKRKGTILPPMFENTITKYLNAEMNEVRQTSDSDIIWWEMTWDYRVNTPADPDDPQKEGEIDIKFRWHAVPANNDSYLAVEAKRLYGTGTSRADDYVKKGVVDFIVGKYSRNHSHGIMLGYVLVGPIDKAVQAVDNAMSGRRRQTSEHSAFCLDASLCSHPNTHHSVHIQQPTQVPITLVHLFLDLT